MSSPTINRWGLNLFWYRFWYSDKNLDFWVSQDDLFNRLLLIYIHYGVFFNKTFFLNSYWWPNFKNYIKNYNLIFNSKYFRIVEYKNKIIDETRRYALRNKVKNLYFSKLWILRYQNWLVINLYAYQPLNKKRNKKIKNSKDINFYAEKNNSNQFRLYRRLKFYLFFFLYKNTLNDNNYYLFN